MEAPHPAGWALGMALVLGGIVTVAFAPALAPFAIMSAVAGAATLCATFTLAATRSARRKLALRGAMPVVQDVQILQALRRGQSRVPARPASARSRSVQAALPVIGARRAAPPSGSEVGPVLVVPLPRSNRPMASTLDPTIEANVERVIQAHAAPLPDRPAPRPSRRPKRVRTGQRTRPVRIAAHRLERRIRAR